MSIYVIADLHLAFNENKPMDIFGENWKDHEKKIKENWLAKVKPSDMVILPGDFSWSMQLENTYQDFAYLNQLPGKKLLVKGNHDYWWTTITKMKKYLKENNLNNIDFLYNNSYEFENRMIVGSRGWTQGEEPNDKKIYEREQMRLIRSIEHAKQNATHTSQMIAFMHYPPITKSNIVKNEPNEWIEILNQYQIKQCYYGHLHSQSIQDAVQGDHFGIDFTLVSADALNFNLIEVKG